MANYTDDFEGYTPGSGLPTGWTSRWDTPTAWSVVDTSGDQSLKIEPTSNRCFASMDAIDSDANRDNVEILARLKTSSVSAGNAHAHLVLRGSGNGSAETGYVCGFVGDDLRIGKYVSATFTEISLSGQTLSANTYYWIRFRANSTSLKARIWADGGSEPGTWTIDTTDSSITGTGWAGCFSFLGGQSSQFSDVAVATNGDTASMSSGPTYTLTAAAGSFSLTGNAAGLTAARQITAASGSYTLTGNAANLTAARLLTAANGSFVLTGNDATLTYTPSGATYSLAAASGTFALTGNAANLTVARLLTADAGIFVLTGRDAALYGPGEAPVIPPSGGGIGHGKRKKRRVYIERDGNLHVFIDAEHADAFLNATKAVKEARKLPKAKQIKKAIKAAEKAISEAKPALVLPLAAIPALAPNLHQAKAAEKLIRQAQWAHIVAMYEKWIEDDDEDILLLAA